MASLSSLAVHAIAQLPSWHLSITRGLISSSLQQVQQWSSRQYRLPHLLIGTSSSSSRSAIPYALPAIAALAVVAEQQSSVEISTVAWTKSAFLSKYKRPVPNIYSTMMQELLVHQHVMRYNATYQYNAIFGLGFVTVFDHLFDGFPSSEDKELIFKAYISALKEDLEQYRSDARKLKEWAKQQSATLVVSFGKKDGEIESLLKHIAERAGGKGNFYYSRYFAIGLFCVLEQAKVSHPAILEQLDKAINTNKLSIDIDMDLDVYRNLLSKLAQAKDLLKEYVDREKRKQAKS